LIIKASCSGLGLHSAGCSKTCQDRLVAPLAGGFPMIEANPEMLSSVPRNVWLPAHGSRTARWLMVLLCLASWRGPIPIIHAHGSEEGADPQLEHHLLSFHHGHLKQHFFAWHMHLLLPWERFDTTQTPDSTPGQTDPLTHNGAVATAFITGQLISNLEIQNSRCCFFGQQQLEQLWSCSALRSQALLPAFDSFFESLLLTAPLCAVLGVALC